MRVIDVDQIITVPIIDTDNDNKVFNAEMSICEFFNKFLHIDVSEITVDVIPIEWIKKVESMGFDYMHCAGVILRMWNNNMG